MSVCCDVAWAEQVHILHSEAYMIVSTNTLMQKRKKATNWDQSDIVV
jgi:hypothetical protein